MELKPGYKQTEVGVIPEDWEVRTLQELCKEEITYGIVQCGPHIPGGIPYIRVSDMDGPILDKEKMLCTSAEIASQFRRSEVRLGDIVYALRGRLGDVRAITPELEGANLTQGTARISPALCVHSHYLLWALRNPDVVLRACAESKGTTFMEITLSDLRKVKIAVPSRSEQLEISSTLSDIDDHLMTLDLELTKKRNIKQAAMQELLTGKRRLPGFEGEWEVKKLGDSALLKARIGWQGLTTAEYLSSGNYYLVTGTEFESGYIAWNNCHFVDEKRYKQDKYIQLRPRDILVTKDGTIGKVALVTELPGQATLNSGIFVIRPLDNAFNPEFFYYLLCSQVFSEFLGQLAAGSTINHLYQKDFVSFSYQKPPTIEEQAAIANILNGIDSELIALKTCLNKTRAIKQGMMQQLLTGKIRLR